MLHRLFRVSSTIYGGGQYAYDHYTRATVKDPWTFKNVIYGRSPADAQAKIRAANATTLLEWEE